MKVKSAPRQPVITKMKTPLFKLRELLSFLEDRFGWCSTDVEIEELAPGFLKIVPTAEEKKPGGVGRAFSGINRRFAFFDPDLFRHNGNSQVAGGSTIEVAGKGWKRCTFELWDSANFDDNGFRPFFESGRPKRFDVSESPATRMKVSDFLARLAGRKAIGKA